MAPLLLHLLTACLGVLAVTPPRAAAQPFTCSDCTIDQPRLPCKVYQGDCDIPLNESVPEVGPVRNVILRREGLYRNETNADLYLTVSWEIPDKGYQYVTGFIITFLSLTSPTKTCYHLDMKKAKWNDEDDMKRRRLYFDCLKVEWETNYFMTILTLPNQVEKSPEQYVQGYKQPSGTSFTVPPSKWTTPIKILKSESNNQIDVQFTPFSHEIFSFESYIVGLISEQETMSVIVSGADLAKPEVSVSFFNVCSPGKWRATVKPLKMVDNQCARLEGLACFDSKENCHPCKKSTSDFFQFEPGNPCRIDSTNQLVATVVGICAGCLLASLLVAIAIYYSKPWVSKKRRPPTTPQPMQNNTDVVVKSVVVDQKRVLLLHEDDHECHTAAVQQLANFLKEHCKCLVTFAQWDQMNLDKGSAAWLLKHLDVSDKIIVIHSEGGYKKYHAKRTGELYDKNASSMIELFVPGVNMIIKERINRDGYFKSSKNTLSAYMPYTPREFVIKETSPSFIFELMKDIDSLVRHIHGVPNVGCTLEGIDTSVNYQQYKDLPGGKDLARAINNMRLVVKENPDWFSDSHNKVQNDNNGDSGRGTMQESNFSSIMEEDSRSVKSYETPEVQPREVEVQIEEEQKEEKIEIPKDNRKAADQREISRQDSRVALLRKSFEARSSLEVDSMEGSRPISKLSMGSTTASSSRKNSTDTKEGAYSPSSSGRLGGSSYNDSIENSIGKSSALLDASRPTSSSASSEPLFKKNDIKATPETVKRKKVGSVKYYSDLVDDAFQDALYGQSMGEPES